MFGVLNCFLPLAALLVLTLCNGTSDNESSKASSSELNTDVGGIGIDIINNNGHKIIKLDKPVYINSSGEFDVKCEIRKDIIDCRRKPQESSLTKKRTKLFFLKYLTDLQAIHFYFDGTLADYRRYPEMLFSNFITVSTQSQSTTFASRRSRRSRSSSYGSTVELVRSVAVTDGYNTVDGDIAQRKFIYEVMVDPSKLSFFIQHKGKYEGVEASVDDTREEGKVVDEPLSQGQSTVQSCVGTGKSNVQTFLSDRLTYVTKVTKATDIFIHLQADKYLEDVKFKLLEGTYAIHTISDILASEAKYIIVQIGKGVKYEDLPKQVLLMRKQYSKEECMGTFKIREYNGDNHISGYERL